MYFKYEFTFLFSSSSDTFFFENWTHKALGGSLRTFQKINKTAFFINLLGSRWDLLLYFANVERCEMRAEIQILTMLLKRF